MYFRSLILSFCLSLFALMIPSFAAPDERLLAQESLELASEQTFHATVTGIHTVRVAKSGWALCAGMMNGQHTWFILQKTGTTWQAVKSLSNYPTADCLHLAKVDRSAWPELLGTDWLAATNRVLDQLQAKIAHQQKRGELPKSERYYFPSLVLDASGYGWASYETYTANGSKMNKGHAFLSIHADRWGIYALITREAEFRPSKYYPIQSFAAVSDLRQTIHSDTNPAKLYALGSVPIFLRSNQGLASDSGTNPGVWRRLVSFESTRPLPRHLAPAPVPAGSRTEIHPLSIKAVEGFWVNREGFEEVIEILNAGPNGWIIVFSINNREPETRYRFEATSRGTLVLYPKSGPEWNIELRCFQCADPARTKVLELRLLDGSNTYVEFVKPPVR